MNPVKALVKRAYTLGFQLAPFIFNGREIIIYFHHGATDSLGLVRDGIERFNCRRHEKGMLTVSR